MASQDNLRPFQPGESGNPGGRPKGSVSLVSALKRHLRENPDDVKAVVQSTIDAAKAGDHQARQLVFDRIDGKVPFSIAALTTEQLLAMLDADDEGSGPTED